MGGIPKSETQWVHITTKSGEEYIITSKKNRETYFLYRIDGEKATLLGRNMNPLKLEEKYIHNK